MEGQGIQQLLLKHVRQLSADVAELKQEGAAPLTDNLAHWLAAQFVVAAKTAAAQTEGGCVELKTLRGLSADLVALRRGDHTADRLKLDWKKYEFDAAKAAMEHAKEIKLIIADKSLTDNDRINRIRLRLFGKPGKEVLKMMAEMRGLPELTEEQWYEEWKT